MGLEELNEKLHGRDVHLDRHERADTFDPKDTSSDETLVSQFTQSEKWAEKVSEEKTPEQILAENEKKAKRKKIALILGGIALLLILGGVVFKVWSMFFDESRIHTSFSGPVDVASGELTSFTFEYINDNWGDLENGKIIFSYPEGFKPEERDGMQTNNSRSEMLIGTIPAQTSGKKLISGKFYGLKGDSVKITATLEYSQKNVTSIHTQSTDFVVRLASSSVLLEIEAPLEIASGQEAGYEVKYKNNGERKFSNLRIELEYPKGFRYIDALPSVSEGNALWRVGDLMPGQEGKIVVRGILDGSNGETKTLRGKIGYLDGKGVLVAYGEHERKTKIVASPLSLNQTVNGVTEHIASLGDTLNYRINFKNEGNIGLRDVIVTVNIDSPLIDFSRLELPMKGAYDVSKKMLTWKATDVPILANLQPGQGGEVQFKVSLFSQLPENLRSEKDTVVRSLAKIDSPDVPTVLESNKVITSNTLMLPVNTALSMNLKGYYADTTFPNTGPIPPLVGKETTYTLHFSLENTFNEVSNSKVLFSLPTNVRYMKKSSPETEKIVFNERTNELVWEIGTFARTSKREVVFQIGITPNPNQVSAPANLVHKYVFSGRNNFTQKDIRLEKTEKTSYLPEDTSLPADHAQVKAN